MKSFTLILDINFLKNNSGKYNKESYNFLGTAQGHKVFFTPTKSVVMLSHDISSSKPRITAFNKTFDLKAYKISDNDFINSGRSQKIITPVYNFGNLLDFKKMLIYRKENLEFHNQIDNFLLNNSKRIKEILKEVSKNEKVLFFDENTFSFNEINEVLAIDEDDPFLD